MKYSDAVWIEKKKKGLGRYLLFDGILIMGGPFAVIMQGIGYFFLRAEGQRVGEYFSSSRMWITFFFHATLFGLVMGLIYWFGHEKAYRTRTNISPIPKEDQEIDE